jgi:LmbE family N-acetylglucosaminyl deacetylase
LTKHSKSVSEQLTVLAVLAHPDDEGFGCGGTLAALVAGGHRVTLICATNGDVGEISDPALATPETLWQVRQRELRTAMDVTGIEDVRFLNYRDSGMAGTEDNDHQSSLFQAPEAKVVEQVAAVIRETRPDVVITHDPTGGYGHPDHVTICRRTVSAVELCSNENGPQLYFLCFPRSAFQRMWQAMVEADIRPPFSADDVEALGTPDDEVTTVRRVDRFVAVKKESLRCHRTQIGDDGPFSQLSEEVLDEIMSTEYFQLVSVPGVTSRDILAELPES